MAQNIHYEMEDLLEQANEIQESLGRSYAVPDELDEADLEAGTCLIVDSQNPDLSVSELDALQLEVEEEGPSYLSDLNKVPDFVDEPPVEVTEVSSPGCSGISTHHPAESSKGSSQDRCMTITRNIHISGVIV